MDLEVGGWVGGRAGGRAGGRVGAHGVCGCSWGVPVWWGRPRERECVVTLGLPLPCPAMRCRTVTCCPALPCLCGAAGRPLRLHPLLRHQHRHGWLPLLEAGACLGLFLPQQQQQ